MGVPEVKKDAIVYIHPDFRAHRCPCCGKGEMHVIMSFGANEDYTNFMAACCLSIKFKA